MASKGDFYKHRRRGSSYEVLGLASIQNANMRRLAEGDAMVVYRDSDGDLWTREQSEFEDGRFEKMEKPAPQANHAYAVYVGKLWYVVKAVSSLRYSDAPDRLVWSEVATTAWIAEVGAEHERVWLGTDA